MSRSRLHHHVPTTVVSPRHEPLLQPMASSARLRHSSKVAVSAGDPPVSSAIATTPEASACPAKVTGSAQASQHEFYQYFGLALLALLAISVLVAARG
jgi:hypothetical protein